MPVSPAALATSDIVSAAFLAMEKTPPASFDDDSQEADLTQQFYEPALKRCLESADWSFASRYAELPPADLPDGEVTDPTLPHFYRLPGDCIQIREVGAGAAIRWRRDQAGLRADAAAPLPLRYTATVAAEGQLPVAFRTAVALQLAIYLAPRFLGTQGKMEVLKRDLDNALETAQREDGRSASPARYDGLPDQGDWAREATW